MRLFKTFLFGCLASGEGIHCQRKSDCLADPRAKCRDGSCVCNRNIQKCEIVECSTNSNCGYRQICRDNSCVDVDCTSHSQCWDDSGANGVRGRCIENVCEYETSYECVTRNDCDASIPEACNTAINKCVPVECRDDAQCPSDKKCNKLYHVCEHVECKFNSQCQYQEKCEDYQCVSVECLSNKDCSERAVTGGLYPEICNKRGFCEPVECIQTSDCPYHNVSSTDMMNHIPPQVCWSYECVEVECSKDIHCTDPGWKCAKRRHLHSFTCVPWLTPRV